ncbi:chromosomal replication initiator protein DnaA [Amylibacter sp.]|nr:chromosomal replication initiator protein DnaA [Amylibacter sp.]
MGIEIWPIIKLALRKTVGEAAFTNWINPLELRSLDKSKASFVAPTKFIGDWVDRNYGDSIKFEFAKQGLDVDRLSFTVDMHSKRVQFEKPAINSNKDNMKTGSADLPGASLDPRYTFDNFVVGKPNELAHAAARRVAEGGDVSFNPLFLHGGVGLGKTHLMHAIAWEIKKRDPNAKVLYLSAEQFMYRFVQALRFKDTISFKEMFRSVDVLMVDDVQFIAGKSSTQEEFFHTFNALIDQNKQVIISGDRAPVDMEQLEDRIKSRLQWGLVVDVHPTDYELRLGILQSKQETQSRYNSTVEVSPGVLEFMAQRISSNVRVLEGALTRLYAFGSLVGRPVTLEMAQESLSDILRASDRKVTIDEIIRKVTDHYGVNLTDMLSARRTRSIARPRQVAMYLSKKLTSKSLPEIGRRFGKRDHTTVIHAVKKIEELQSVDNQIAKDIEVLRRVLEG